MPAISGQVVTSSLIEYTGLQFEYCRASFEERYFERYYVRVV